MSRRKLLNMIERALYIIFKINLIMRTKFSRFKPLKSLLEDEKSISMQKEYRIIY